jgi:hypothetical protein
MVFTGMSGLPIAETDQRRGNATACAGYLRGWLDHEAYVRALAPQLGQCTRPTNDNAVVVTAFLTLVQQPHMAQMDLQNLMTYFGAAYCQPAQARTQIMPQIYQPVVPQMLAPVPQSAIQGMR